MRGSFFAPKNPSVTIPQFGSVATPRGIQFHHTAAPHTRRMKRRLFQSRAVLSPQSVTEGPIEKPAGDNPALKNIFKSPP